LQHQQNLYYQDKNIIMGALASFFSNPRTIQAIGEIGVGIFSANEASKSRRRAEDFLGKLEEKQASRQQITNPYANIENPYKNLAVATQAAKMQAEEADIALANTLDTLRATGKSAGGATALAQAALKSKQQISANIEQQEINNQKLKAQGQLQVDTARAKGEAFRMQMQESRDIEDIDRLQYSADLAASQQQNQAANAVSGILGGVAGLGAVGMKSFMRDDGSNNPIISNTVDPNALTPENTSPIGEFVVPGSMTEDEAFGDFAAEFEPDIAGRSNSRQSF